MKKVCKKLVSKSLVIIVSIVFIFVVIVVTYVFENKELYQMQKSIKNEFDCVDGLNIANAGDSCSIFVYLKGEGYSLEDIEPIFIKVMEEVLEEGNISYLRKKYSPRYQLDIPSINIRFVIFKDDDTKRKLLYKFISQYEYTVWKLDGNPEITYKTSDYLENYCPKE